jgi:hypothetical protein
MRNPLRIPIMCKQLECIWKTMPDMRFFQLVEFIGAQAVPGPIDNRDTFYTEDDKTMKTLDSLVREYTKKKKEG